MRASWMRSLKKVDDVLEVVVFDWALHPNRRRKTLLATGALAALLLWAPVGRTPEAEMTANEAFQAGVNRALPLGSPFTAGLTGTRATAYVEFGLSDDTLSFTVNSLTLETPEGGDDCATVRLDRKKSDGSFENVGILALQDGKGKLEMSTPSSASVWRLSNFGGSASGSCKIDSVQLSIQMEDEFQFAKLDLPYVDASVAATCNVCQTCFAKNGCRRYSDARVFRFKACTGTSDSCNRGVGVEDEEGEITFAGEPFQSEILSIIYGKFEWSGKIAYRLQEPVTAATAAATTDSRSDWQCYLDRYGTSKIANTYYDTTSQTWQQQRTEVGALRHWNTIGDKNGWLWGCFTGYYDETPVNRMNPETFVLTSTSVDGWDGESMKPNLALSIPSLASAEKGFVYLTTFEESTIASRPRTIPLPMVYSITGGNTNTAGVANPSVPFVINPTTGQVSVRKGIKAEVVNGTMVGHQALLYTAKDMYTLEITATDQGGLTATATMAVTILPGNWAPEINDAKRSIDENAMSRNIDGVMQGTDPDVITGSQRLTYTISAGDSNGYFTINPTSGQISTTGTAKLDFETQDTYQLTIKAQDNGPGTLSDSCLVTVTRTRH